VFFVVKVYLCFFGLQLCRPNLYLVDFFVSLVVKLDVSALMARLPRNGKNLMIFIILWLCRLKYTIVQLICEGKFSFKNS